VDGWLWGLEIYEQFSSRAFSSSKATQEFSTKQAGLSTFGFRNNSSLFKHGGSLTRVSDIHMEN
jgi:hypothetical protein